MNVCDIALNEIKPYERNPRKNRNAVDTVAESIKEFGFKVPLVIDADGVIVSKLEETTLSSIALSVLVANLFGIPFGPFFIIFLRDDQNIGKKHHILRFFDNDDSFS